MAVYDDILNACLAVLQAVSFAGLLAANVKVRALPRVGETLDALPCILIAPYGRLRQFGNSFESTVDVYYPVEVAIVAASNRDMQTNLGQYATWHEQARKALSGPLLIGAATVWNANVDPSPVIDRGKLNQQYAYLSLLVQFVSNEARN